MRQPLSLDFILNFAVAVGGSAVLAYIHYLTYRNPGRSRVTRFIFSYYQRISSRDPEAGVLASCIMMTLMGVFLTVVAFIEIHEVVFWSFTIVTIAVSLGVAYRRFFR